MTFTEGLDFCIEFLGDLFAHFDAWMITSDVSALGFSVGVTVTVILIGALILRV